MLIPLTPEGGTVAERIFEFLAILGIANPELFKVRHLPAEDIEQRIVEFLRSMHPFKITNNDYHLVAYI
ncbi:hypothetical protein [Sphingobacterium hungaricum]